jgi:hypothetical protein
MSKTNLEKEMVVGSSSKKEHSLKPKMKAHDRSRKNNKDKKKIMKKKTTTKEEDAPMFTVVDTKKYKR